MSHTAVSTSEVRRGWLEGRLGLLLSGAAAVAFFVAIEILEDGFSLHVLGAGLLESVAMALPVVITVQLYRQVQRQRRENGALVRELDRARRAGEDWRYEKRAILQGLGAAIDEQFRAWSLTGAESEVSMLMLKGLNHREIAELRGTSERTVRQQARSVYGKAGISGRTALSAYFLEDLLLPQDQRS